MNWIDRMAKVVLQSIQEQEKHKTQPLDTVGEVKRVDDDYAWIQFAGATEPTPVKKTISVKKGDKVPVRVSKGSAWIVGNETAPPTDDTLAKKAMSQANNAGRTAKRASDLSIIADVMYYLASDQEEGVTTEDEGWTKEPQEVTESLPYLWAYHDYERGNGKHFKSEPVIIAMYAEGGKGIDNLTTYYALGTSTSTAPTTGWATSFTYLSGYYIWRKELITYDDGTTKWTTAVYDAGLTQSSSLSYDTAQYIWTETTGLTNVPTGQYVTEVNKTSYRSNPTGNALLLRSAGIYLRNGINTVASFLDAGVSLFNLTGSKLAEFLTSGMRIYSSDYPSKPVVDIYVDDAVFGGTLVLNRMNSNETGSMTYHGIDFSNGYGMTGTIDCTSGKLRLDASTSVSVLTNLNVSGNLGMSTGKITAGAINESLFAVSSESVSTSSGTGNLTGTATATKVGYYPLAIAGLSIATGGCYSRGVYLTAQSSGSCTVNFRAYNDSGKSQAVSATAYVLWVKTTY